MSSNKRPVEKSEVSAHVTKNQYGARLDNAGLRQGDMAPKVEDYQKPLSCYSQNGFSKTTQYIERHNEFESHEASQVKSQAYKGRYS